MARQKKKGRKNVPPPSSSAAHLRRSSSTPAGSHPQPPESSTAAPQPPIYRFSCPKLASVQIPSQRVWEKDINRESVKGDYNAWMSVEIWPTPVAHFSLMHRLMIEKYILRLLDDIGLGTICLRQYDLYHELVRQFMASIRVYYVNDMKGNAKEGA